MFDPGNYQLELNVNKTMFNMGEPISWKIALDMKNPAMLKILGDINIKIILDLGCKEGHGDGERSKAYAPRNDGWS